MQYYHIMHFIPGTNFKYKKNYTTALFVQKYVSSYTRYFSLDFIFTQSYIDGRHRTGF